MCTRLISVTFQGMIVPNNLHNNAFGDETDSDLREKYLAGGPGTYTRPNIGYNGTWTKQVVFVAVTNISDVPTSGTAGTPLALTGTVAPDNATNKTIVWSVKTAGATGATISGNTLTATAAGSVTVTATIANGKTASTPYTQDFSITITSAFVAVTGISGVPTSGTAGNPLTLTGTVAPDNATNKTIAWTVKSAGNTGATISGSTLTATAAGSVTVTATIANGKTASTPYTQDFSITIQAGGVAPGGTYVITGSGTSFTATNSGATIGSGAIQDVIDAIKTHAAGANSTIQFGKDNVLDIGTSRAYFNNSGGTWGAVKLTGKITGAVQNSPNRYNTGTIYIGDSISISSTADISNSTEYGVAIYNHSDELSITGGTVSGASSYAVVNTGTLSITGGTVSVTSGSAVANLGTVNITGGTVKATSGWAVYHQSNDFNATISGGTVSATSGCAVYIYTGTVTVSGTAKVTSANTSSTVGTIYLRNAETATAVRLEITGGTVENTSTGTGNAVYNDSTGAVSITGGTVSKAGSGGYAVYNGGTGAVTIGSGATIEGNRYGF
jgi:endo-1,4-beta-xylanase